MLSAYWKHLHSTNEIYWKHRSIIHALLRNIYVWNNKVIKSGSRGCLSYLKYAFSETGHSCKTILHNMKTMNRVLLFYTDVLEPQPYPVSQPGAIDM